MTAASPAFCQSGDTRRRSQSHTRLATTEATSDDSSRPSYEYLMYLGSSNVSSSWSMMRLGHQRHLLQRWPVADGLASLTVRYREEDCPIPFYSSPACHRLCWSRHPWYLRDECAPQFRPAPITLFVEVAAVSPETHEVEKDRDDGSVGRILLRTRCSPLFERSTRARIARLGSLSPSRVREDCVGIRS